MISPGRLFDIQGVGDPVAVAQTNFEIATEELFEFTPTHQNGSATTVIGPPTTGTHTEDERWHDAWLGEWRCTVAGTPGTWRQERSAIRAGEPASGTIPTGYLIQDSSDSYRYKIHLGSYAWRAVTPNPYSYLTLLTGGSNVALDSIVTVGLALNTIASFVYSGRLYTFRLRSGTDTEQSPYLIRPDDYATTTNEKVWERLFVGDYPYPFFFQDLSGLTGGTSADLNSIPTLGMPLNSTAFFYVSGSLVAYRLRSGTDATASPTVIRPVDFQSVTNPKVWERVLIIAAPGDAMIGNNNLSEVASSTTKRAASRANIDVPWADDVRGWLVTKAPRGGLFADGSASYILSGTSGVNFGTSDFTILVSLRLTDYTPASTATLFASHTSGNNRIVLNLLTNGQLSLAFIDSGGSTTAYSMTPDVSLVDGETYLIAVTADRDGNATLYINGVSDRDKSGSGVTVSISGSSAVDIGSGNANVWGAFNTVFGTLYGLRAFNQAISSATVLILAQSGAVPYSDLAGAVSASYTSDFSAGVDGWTGSEMTVSGNVDGIGGQDNNLSAYASVNNTTHFAAKASVLSVGRRYLLTFSYRIPSANTNLKQLLVRDDGSTTISDALTATDAWTSVSLEFVAVSTGLRFYGRNASASITFAGAGSASDDLFYIRGVTIQPLGAVLDVEVETARPSQSTAVRDRSAAANHGTATTALSQVFATKQLNPEALTVGGSSRLVKLLSATASLNFGSINAAASADLTITVTGAAEGDAVAIGLPASPAAGIVFFGFVSATNTVTIRAMNITGSPVDPASATYRATVFQFA